MSKSNHPEALIFSIQRMSTEDGPGIRTTVFFKGCGLNCGWCHNPESISMKPEIQWFSVRCIHCKICLQTCPVKAIEATDTMVSVNRNLCDRCGKCAEECPANAMEQIGRTWKMNDLLDEVEKDRVYFEKSGGGVTVSGGEPMMQADFIISFLCELKNRGIHTALDTSGHCNAADLTEAVRYTDLILFDLKVIDTGKHKLFTGHSNELILSNLKMTAGMLTGQQELWIRTPMIPGATATDENIRDIGNYIAALNGKKVSHWELCSFNNLCRDKFGRMGKVWEYERVDSFTTEEMEYFAEIARQSGIDPGIVIWTGAVKVNK